MPTSSRLRPRSLATLLALTMPIATLAAQLTSAAATRTGRVRGVVIDSLLGAPLVDARVHIGQVGRETRTDSTGRFVLDSVPPGEWIVAFSHPELDSLGIQNAGTHVRVFAGATATVTLATPPIDPLRERLCGSTPDSLSPTVAFGGVRAADGGRAIVHVAVSWVLAGTSTPPPTVGTVRTIANGDDRMWVACGIPWGAWLYATINDSTHSTSIVLQIGARGLAVRDLVLAKGVSVITGTVRDGNAPVKGAWVSVLGTPVAAETDASGAFTLTDAPNGSVTVDVRAAGYRPCLATYESTAGGIDAHLQPTVEVDSASAPSGSDYVRLLQRRDQKGMLLLAGPALMRDGAALDQLLPSNACRWWLDGRPVEREFLLAQPLRTWRAVELYPNGLDAPVEYRSAGCAVVLMWTTSADW